MDDFDIGTYGTTKAGGDEDTDPRDYLNQLLIENPTASYKALRAMHWEEFVGNEAAEHIFHNYYFHNTLRSLRKAADDDGDDDSEIDEADAGLPEGHAPRASSGNGSQNAPDTHYRCAPVPTPQMSDESQPGIAIPAPRPLSEAALRACAAEMKLVDASLLDTVKLNGVPYGDLMAGEVRTVSRWGQLLADGLPDDAIIREHRTKEDANRMSWLSGESNA